MTGDFRAPIKSRPLKYQITLCFNPIHSSARIKEFIRGGGNYFVAFEIKTYKKTKKIW